MNSDWLRAIGLNINMCNAELFDSHLFIPSDEEFHSDFVLETFSGSDLHKLALVNLGRQSM